MSKKKTYFIYFLTYSEGQGLDDFLNYEEVSNREFSTEKERDAFIDGLNCFGQYGYLVVYGFSIEEFRRNVELGFEEQRRAYLSQFESNPTDLEEEDDE